MEIGVQPKLKFLGVEIINVQYTLNDRLGEDSNIELSVSPSVYYPEEDKNSFTILMSIQFKFEDAFHLYVHAAGRFILEDIEHDSLIRKSLVNANAPAIMFPYVRSFISTFTGNLGGAIKPILLPTHFFTGELEEVKLATPVEANI